MILFFALVSNGQELELKKLSNVKAALLIDSLESVKEVQPKNNFINYQLAYYYFQIDNEASKKNSILFISLADSTTSPTQLYNIYGILASVHENRNNYDSTLYYLDLQKGIINDVSDERVDSIKSTYLGSIMDDEEKSIYGSGYLYISILVSLVIINLILFIRTRSLSKKYAKSESLKNQELEAVNTKLQKFNDDLQQAVMEHTYTSSIKLEESSNEIVELRKSLRKAEEANYLKNAFLGTMSHQIRTPLSGIMGFSNILETELAIMGNEELFEYAKNIQEAGEKLMGLITNIIDISSIEANILELKILPCNISSIFSEIESIYSTKAKDRGLIFKAKADKNIPLVFADKENLVKSVNIILDNAIQYSSKGFVTLSATNKDAEYMEIEIKDKGTGIDEDTLTKLNDSFDYSKHGSSLTYQGHGLGLILAHRLISLMNGNFALESKPGKGTKVTFTLPFAKDSKLVDNVTNQIVSDTVQPKSQDASIVSAPDFGKLKIFVVEDDRMNRLVLEKMLKNMGKITTAADGNEALNKIDIANKKGLKFDVFLLDMNLPSPWDGMKLMTEIKKRYPWTNYIPFIAQTAYAMAGDKDRYLDAGFNDYITKPINKNELLTMIHTQLELFKKSGG